jgi:hypothetical protein
MRRTENNDEGNGQTKSPAVSRGAFALKNVKRI